MAAAWQVRVLQQYVAQQGTTSTALNYDFGLITLASPAPSGTTSMNIAVCGTGASVVYNLQTAGYPADKPSQTMWQVGLQPCVTALSCAQLNVCMEHAHSVLLNSGIIECAEVQDTVSASVKGQGIIV